MVWFTPARSFNDCVDADWGIPARVEFARNEFNLQLTVEEARAWINRFLATYPGVARWQREQEARTRETRTVSTRGGQSPSLRLGATRGIQRMTKRCTRRSISSAASKKTRPTLRTPRRRFRTRGRAIAHGIQPGPKVDATRLSTGSVLRPRNDLSLMWVSGHIAGWIKQYKLGASIQMLAPAPSRSQLPCWGGRTRTQKCRRKTSL